MYLIRYAELKNVIPVLYFRYGLETCITRIIHQELWEYNVEEKLQSPETPYRL
jgi:hypothetical protein